MEEVLRESPQFGIPEMRLKVDTRLSQDMANFGIKNKLMSWPVLKSTGKVKAARQQDYPLPQIPTCSRCFFLKTWSLVGGKNHTQNSRASRAWRVAENPRMNRQRPVKMRGLARGTVHVNLPAKRRPQRHCQAACVPM